MCSGVMIPYLARTAKPMLLNDSCPPVVSRAAPVIHHPQPHRDAPPVQEEIAARVTNDVFSSWHHLKAAGYQVVIPESPNGLSGIQIPAFAGMTATPKGKLGLQR